MKAPSCHLPAHEVSVDIQDGRFREDALESGKHRDTSLQLGKPLSHRRRVFAEHERARHDPVGTGLVDQRDRVTTDTAVELDIDPCPVFLDRRTEPRGSCRDRRIHRGSLGPHRRTDDRDLIDQVPVWLQDADRLSDQERDADELAESLGLLDGRGRIAEES